MRTTLDIDQDVLAAAKEIAVGENSTAGKVLSRLARAALMGTPMDEGNRTSDTNRASEASHVYGFEPFNSSGAIVTNDLINKLRQEEGI
jgi:hypothetical protein